MTDYLASMIARSRDAVGAVRPRVGSLFESPQVIVERAADGPAPRHRAPHAWTAAPDLVPAASPPPSPPAGEPAASPATVLPAAAPARAAASAAGTKRPATATGDPAGRTAQAEQRPNPPARRRGAAVAATPTAPRVRARR